MRKDLAKVLTEKPRSGSSSRNLKTRFREKSYDDRESKEDKYSLPKRGKMLMHNRDLGSHNDDKNFTDVLNPLKRWVEAQVGRNWDTVYSEIKTTLPNTNKQNHHLIDTHLMGYINRNVIVVKSKKGRKVYDDGYRFRFDSRRELLKDEIYVDPDTHVLMKYRHGKDPHPWRTKAKPKVTPTGYIVKDNQIQLADGSHIENINGSWVMRKWVEHKYVGPGGFTHTTIEMVLNHPLSKKELKIFGLTNSLPCDGKIIETGVGYYKRYKCNKCEATFAHKDYPKHGVVEKE